MRNLILLMAAAAPAACLAKDLVGCDWQEALDGRASREGHVVVTFDGGKISALTFTTSASSGEEGGGYMCDFSSSASDPKAERSEERDGTHFTLTVMTWQPSFLVSKEGRAYVITTDHTSALCGAGAEYPVRTWIIPGKKACKVEYLQAGHATPGRSFDRSDRQ